MTNLNELLTAEKAIELSKKGQADLLGRCLKEINGQAGIGSRSTKVWTFLKDKEDTASLDNTVNQLKELGYTVSYAYTHINEYQLTINW